MLSYILINIVAIVCWTVLAIIFNKWWIALFALLFLCYKVEKHYKCRVCDNCGKTSPPANDNNEAITKARADGWLTFKKDDKWVDYCPECRNNKCARCANKNTPNCPLAIVKKSVEGNERAKTMIQEGRLPDCNYKDKN